MTVRHFPSYSEARANLRGVLDAANSGVVTTLERDHTRFAVVDSELLRSQLAALRPARAAVTAEGSGWSAFLVTHLRTADRTMKRRAATRREHVLGEVEDGCTSSI